MTTSTQLVDTMERFTGSWPDSREPVSTQVEFLNDYLDALRPHAGVPYADALSAALLVCLRRYR